MNVCVAKDIFVAGARKFYEIYVGMPLKIFTKDYSKYGDLAGVALANDFTAYALILGFTAFAFSLAVKLFGTFGIPVAILAAIIVFGVMEDETNE